MNIKAIVIEGTNGDVEITRTATGAQATRNHDIIAEVSRGDDREDRYASAVSVARAIYRADRRGGAAATNSMVHAVLDQIERVAGI
ncbi:MAG: hypothetical protein IT430_03780 [Phycisphaerales bacterium]|nr:hypothetical protein [Phycisphaerales bacterium]